MSDDHVTKTIATYNSLSEEYAKKFAKYPPVAEWNIFLSKLPKQAKILDVGCGSGRDSKYFSSKGHGVIGIDLSSKLLTIAKKAVPKANFKLMDLRKMTFPDKTFDGIWACASLLHIKRNEILPVIYKIYSLLKPNGILFILTREGIGEKQDVRLYTYVTQEELTNILVTVGFSIEKMYTWDQKDIWPERSNRLWIASFSRKK